jgi:hypothetical protein
MEKPNAQTTLQDILPMLLPLKLERVYGIGRKTCQVIRSSLNWTKDEFHVRDCLTISKSRLEQILSSPKLASYVFLAVRGVDLTPVNHETSWEFKTLSVGDSMRRLETLESVSLYLKSMAADLLKRIDDESDGRVPTLLTLKVRFIATDSSISRTCSSKMPIEISQSLRVDASERANLLYKLAFQMFRKHFPAPFKITLLCLTASKFLSQKDGQHVRQRSILECMSTTPPKRRDSTKDEESYLSQISENVLTELPLSLQREILDRKKRLSSSNSSASFSSQKKKRRKKSTSARNITSYFSKS